MTDDATEEDGWEARPGSAFKGARWNASERAFVQTVRFLSSIVLARLVAPSDFGIMAIALSVTEMLEVMKDVGTGRAIIQLERVTRSMYNSIFTLNLALGSLTAGTLALSAEWVSMIYDVGDPLPAVLQLIALTFLVSATTHAQFGLLRRRLAFRLLALANISGAVANAVVTIWLALRGHGVWALAVGYLAGNLVTAVLIWVLNPWNPRPGLRIEDLKEVAGFSVNLTFSNIIGLVLGSADTLIISRMLGISATGYYSIAKRIVGPIRVLSQVTVAVSSPALARVQRDHEALQRDFLRASSGIALVICPMLFGIAIAADPGVSLLFGDRWTPVVPVVKIFSLTTLLVILLGFAQSLYFTKRRMDRFLWRTIILNALQVTGWLVGVRFGLTGVVAGQLLVYSLIFLPFVRVVLGLIDMPISSYFSSLAPFLRASAAMSAVAIGSKWACEGAGLPDWGILLATTFAGAAAYAAVILWERPPALDDLRRLTGLPR